MTEEHLDIDHALGGQGEGKGENTRMSRAKRGKHKQNWEPRSFLAECCQFPPAHEKPYPKFPAINANSAGFVHLDVLKREAQNSRFK